MNYLKPAIIGLTAAFLLTACNDDNETKTDVASSESHIDQERYLQETFRITTADNRNLEVQVAAYCENLEDVSLTEYKTACRTVIEKRLAYSAGRECFEGVIPATSPDVRNHEGLPQRAGDKCYDRYPENMASFPEDMMKRTLGMTPKDDLYTVTAIKPL